MATSNSTPKIMFGKNLQSHKDFKDNLIEGAICLNILDDPKVQELVYKYEGKRYLNVKVVKRKAVSKFDKTHYIEIDTFVPEHKGEK